MYYKYCSEHSLDLVEITLEEAYIHTLSVLNLLLKQQAIVAKGHFLRCRRYKYVLS